MLQPTLKPPPPPLQFSNFSIDDLPLHTLHCNVVSRCPCAHAGEWRRHPSTALFFARAFSACFMSSVKAADAKGGGAGLLVFCTARRHSLYALVYEGACAKTPAWRPPLFQKPTRRLVCRGPGPHTAHNIPLS